MAAGFQFSESGVHMACHITVPRDHKSEGGTLSLTAWRGECSAGERL